MFQFALQNLLSRPLRSALALCGLTVAIAGMVGLFSVAEGIQQTVNSTFERMPGLVLIQPGAPIPLFSRLPAKWQAEIEQVPGVAVTHAEVWGRAHLVEGKPAISPPRFLFGLDLPQSDRLRFSVYRNDLQEGRMLTSSDAGTNRCVISRPIADEYKKGLGDTLRVDGEELEIVGIYHCRSLFLDVAILIDIELARTMGLINPETVSNFYVEPEAQASRDELSGRLRKLFEGRAPGTWQPDLTQALEMTGNKSLARQVGTLIKQGTPGSKPAGGSAGARGEGTVEVRSPEEWADQFQQFSADLDLFLYIMTAIGVSIAFVGIVNTMLMSVSERITEFGVLKANGWSAGQVLRLIGCESAILGLCGGVLGCIVGWLGTLVINALFPTRIHLYASPKLLVASLLFSIVLGVLGGLYPAARAAKMTPMEAIRRG